MKVTGSGPNSTDRTRDTGSAGAAAAIGAGKEKRRAGRGEEASSESSEKVAISSRAKDIAKAMEAANSAPEIDEAKVAKFRDAIQNGSYKVDAEKVASRLVDEQLASAF